MKSFRYFVRFLSVFTRRFKGLLLIGAVLGILFFFLGRIVYPLFFGRTTEKIGITGRYHTENLPNFILEKISIGLTAIDDSGTVVPALASSWQSPDKGKTWIFTLKDDLYWQDGEKIESDSIVYEFSDVEIKKPDEKTIIFKLQEPFSPFPSVVSKPTFRKGLLGTGEWRVSDVSIAGTLIQKLVLVDRNKNKEIYKFYPTEERTKLAFKLGEVDKVMEVFVPSPLDLWKIAETKAEENLNRIAVIFFNTADPLLSEKSLRQSLIYSINKEALDGKRAISSIDSSSWAYNPQVKKYTYDTERAEELLDDLPEERRQDLTVKLVSTPILLPVAEKIAKYWQAIGVKTIVQVTSIVPSEFQAYLTVLDVPKDPDQYSLWHSTQQGTNISNYSNPRIDKLLEDGRSELSLEERKKIYLDFQRFLAEDSPAAFLYHPLTYTILRK